MNKTGFIRSFALSLYRLCLIAAIVAILYFEQEIYGIFTFK